MTARWPRATTLDGFFDALGRHGTGDGPLTRGGLVRATAAAVRLAWGAGGGAALDGLPRTSPRAGGDPRPSRIEDAEPALAQVEWWVGGATGSDLSWARDAARDLLAAARFGYRAAAEALGDDDPGDDRARLDHWLAGAGPAVAHWQVEALSELIWLTMAAAGGGDDVTGPDVRHAHHACRAAGLVLYGLGERERLGRRWASETRVLVAMRAALVRAPAGPAGRFPRGGRRARATLPGP